MRLLVLHGPNLNLLGVREPEIYGAMTLDELNQTIFDCFGRAHDIEFLQSNHEGALIDALHRARTEHDAVVFNPGAYTHYAYALLDAVSAIGIPVVEVHLSDIHTREAFRQVSVIKDACRAQVSGLGSGSYLRAIEILEEELRNAS